MTTACRDKRRFGHERLYALALRLLVLSAACGCAGPRSAPEPGGPVVGDVTIRTLDVYDLEKVPGIFYRLVNALNITVRPEVIRREVYAVLKPVDLGVGRPGDLPLPQRRRAGQRHRVRVLAGGSGPRACAALAAGVNGVLRWP